MTFSIRLQFYIRFGFSAWVFSTILICFSNEFHMFPSPTTYDMLALSMSMNDAPFRKEHADGFPGDCKKKVFRQGI